ncbi:tripartite tricarboxylate transporter permease [Candidatus Woesearchaeota archaeon]|nr:tripartite tricarboxylate transporter permease [Candidatus Woesearchaeota archaeon]
MFLELLLAASLGIFAGIFTGLTPGVHINLVAILVVSSASYLLGIFSLASLGVFIIAMAITHTFLDTIPAIFLGAPEADTALGVLPGHKLLLQGRGYEAVKLTIVGSFFSFLLALAFFPLFIWIVPRVYEGLQKWIAWILIVIMAYMILGERSNEARLYAAVVFLLSGILGAFVFNFPNLNQPLFPLLSGLFGISMLIVSLSDNAQIPKQYITDEIRLGKWQSFKALLSATFSGSLVSFFPGLGPAQAAIIGSNTMGKTNNYTFLVLVGGINTVNMLVSLVSLYTIDKARNGAVLAMQQIIDKVDFNMLILFIGTSLFAAGIATFLTLYISRVFSNVISHVNYKVLTLSIITFIVALTFYFSSFMGLLILITSTAIGIIPNVVNVKRSHAMGCLILPVILFFLL